MIIIFALDLLMVTSASWQAFLILCNSSISFCFTLAKKVISSKEIIIFALSIEHKWNNKITLLHSLANAESLCQFLSFSDFCSVIYKLNIKFSWRYWILKTFLQFVCLNQQRNWPVRWISQVASVSWKFPKSTTASPYLWLILCNVVTLYWGCRVMWS